MEPGPPALQVDSLPAKLPGKLIYKYKIMTYSWLLYGGSQHSIVKQLSSNFKKKKMEEKPIWIPLLFPFYKWGNQAQKVWWCRGIFSSVQFSGQSCLTLCYPRDCSTLDFTVHHQLPELAQTHVHRVGDVIQPSHLLSSPSLPAFNLSQHQGLF